ncbi:acyl-CoA thioesterase [Actinoplanes siamensis]|uniref:acyl-CoA thioesterase n=1 Tax=Actinoplanes siamensis TaxID=1223317 RepID=UPI001940B492|nr:thioesterase family protein [Actinoplanes siamensis]
MQFADVDMHGNLHNARLLALAEAAIDEALLDAGIDLTYDPATAEAAFLVKRTSVEYLAPLRYRDHYACALRSVDVGAASITFTVDVHRVRPRPEPAASATVMWVRVNLTSRSPVRIPSQLAEELKDAVATPND